MIEWGREGSGDVVEDPAVEESGYQNQAAARRYARSMP